MKGLKMFNADFVGKLDFEGVKTHMLAGNSILTFKSLETGNHFTFKVKKHKEKNLWFVFYLGGPDNGNDFRYLGTILKGDFRLTRNSRCTTNSQVYKVFKWIFNILKFGDKFPENLEAWHEGICGKCGRKLTVPESIENGFGPVCMKTMAA